MRDEEEEEEEKNTHTLFPDELQELLEYAPV
jgi:hypothetical protein